MKRLFEFIIVIIIIWITAMVSCKKEQSKPANRRPVAQAGPDQLIVLKSCSDTGSVELDGSTSYDPDNNIILYNWTYDTGPPGYILKDHIFPKAKLENLVPGVYVFNLFVTDAEYQSSKDQVMITVIGTPKEYDLDLNFNADFKFLDNYQDCYYYYAVDCSYYDYFELAAFGNFQPIGPFYIQIAEHSDSSAQSATSQARIRLYSGNINDKFLEGFCTINFEKLIQQGGGPFSGLFTVQSSSAKTCNGDLVTDLPPLTISGQLDPVSSKASIRVKGKAFF